MVYWKFFFPNDPYNVPYIQCTYEGTCHTYQIFKEHHPKVILCTCSNTFIHPLATFLGTFTHTHTYILSQQEALNKIVNTMEQSGNMRKELKKTIYETVSTLRNLLVTLKVQLEEGKSAKGRLERELKTLKQ